MLDERIDPFVFCNVVEVFTVLSREHYQPINDPGIVIKHVMVISVATKSIPSGIVSGSYR